jgi:hypothetical protein
VTQVLITAVLEQRPLLFFVFISHCSEIKIKEQVPGTWVILVPVWLKSSVPGLDPDPPDPKCFLGLLDPDPLVRGMDLDPDPSIITHK